MAKEINQDLVGKPRAAWTLKMVQDRCHTTADGCWLWRQTTSSRGYPMASIDGKCGVLVRRWVWAHTHGGKIPTGRRWRVVSTCEGGIRCCNPEHLELISSALIVAAQWASGQRAHQVMPDPLGATKITQAQATEIRGDERPAKAVAAAYGLHVSQVHKIRRGESWAPKRRIASVFDLAGVAR